NCHASWPFGLAVFAVIFGSGFFRHDIGNIDASPWRLADVKKLSATLTASVAALFLNPFGWRLVLYPFDMAFRQQMNVGLGEEWASVDFNDFRGVCVLVLLAALFVTALLQHRRWQVVDVLLTAFALFCGLKHIRFF